MKIIIASILYYIRPIITSDCFDNGFDHKNALPSSLLIFFIGIINLHA
jgi:hypothetical protein